MPMITGRLAARADRTTVAQLVWTVLATWSWFDHDTLVAPVTLSIMAVATACVARTERRHRSAATG